MWFNTCLILICDSCSAAAVYQLDQAVYDSFEGIAMFHYLFYLLFAAEDFSYFF